jgi:signal transduction histidine kinase
MLQLAEKYLGEAIAMSTRNGDKDLSSSLLADLAAVNAQQGKYETAYLHFLDYHRLQDSVYSQENKNKIASLESEKAMNLKNKEIEINKLAIANQRKKQIGLIAGLLLLGIIGALLFWQSRTRKKTNTTLMVLNSQLDDANKVKAKFFAILSHDLRGPVANLISFLRLQKEEPGMLSQQQVAANQQKITSAAESLLETMEAMLLWSKGQMENFTPEIKPVPVSQLFNYLERFFAGTGDVQISFSDPGSLLLNTDENYLQTIMHNLTANAIKALKNTPAASIAWKVVQEEGKTYLSITDNGPGLKEAQAKALYDDGAAANTKYGLGLYLVRDLAKAIHCKIALQTQPGAGTTFTLTT